MSKYRRSKLCIKIDTKPHGHAWTDEYKLINLSLHRLWAPITGGWMLELRVFPFLLTLTLKK